MLPLKSRACISTLSRLLRFDQLRTIDGYLLTAQELALGWVAVGGCSGQQNNKQNNKKGSNGAMECS